MVRVLGSQSFAKFARGIYYSECGRVRLYLAPWGWNVYLDGQALTVDGKTWWPTMMEAAQAAEQARECS